MIHKSYQYIMRRKTATGMGVVTDESKYC